MTANTNSNKKSYEERAAAKPTQLHEDFANWLFIQTGVKVDLKTVQLATTMRMDFQSSPENQKALADKKAKAAADKKASAAKKKARLEAALAKLAPVAEVVSETAPKTQAEIVADARAYEEASVKEDLVIVYGKGGEPQVHAKGCADLKKMTARNGCTKENVKIGTYNGLVLEIYSDMIDGGESTLAENTGGYDAKPCCPVLG
jgi:hypothetical protein